MAPVETAKERRFQGMFPQISPTPGNASGIIRNFHLDAPGSDADSAPQSKGPPSFEWPDIAFVDPDRRQPVVAQAEAGSQDLLRRSPLQASGRMRPCHSRVGAMPV